MRASSGRVGGCPSVRVHRRIQQRSARIQQARRRERDARLIRWGVALDAALTTGEITPAWIEDLCRRHLTRDTDLRRALTGPLAPATTQEET